MFARRFALVVAFVLTVVLVGIEPAAAVTKTTFTSTSGTTFISWTTTRSSIPAGNWHEWGAIMVGSFTTTDPRFQGVITFNGTFLLSKAENPYPGFGPVNATWTLDVDGDGVADWEGTQHGSPDYWPVFVTHFVGRGLGQYEGLQVTGWDYNYIEAGYQTMTGEILDPRGQ